MQLTYAQARELILEPTEMGYTLASQDRLWTVFIYDLWSEDAFRFNRLYSTGIDQAWSYEMWENELVWTTRLEAEAYAKRLREWFDVSRQENENPAPEVYVINWGDDARHEATLIGRDGGGRPRKTPKFKGSEKAWNVMTEMHNRWVEEYA